MNNNNNNINMNSRQPSTIRNSQGNRTTSSEETGSTNAKKSNPNNDNEDENDLYISSPPGGHSLNPVSTITSSYTVPSTSQDDPHLPSYTTERETTPMAAARFFLSTLSDSVAVTVTCIPTIAAIWQSRIFVKDGPLASSNMRLSIYANFCIWICVDFYALVCLMTDKQIRSTISKWWKTKAAAAAAAAAASVASGGNGGNGNQNGIDQQDPRGSISVFSTNTNGGSGGGGGGEKYGTRRMTKGVIMARHLMANNGKSFSGHNGVSGKVLLGTLTESNADITSEDGVTIGGGNGGGGGGGMGVGLDSSGGSSKDKCFEEDCTKPPSWNLFCGLVVYTPSRTFAVLSRVLVVYTIVLVIEWGSYWALSHYLGNSRGAVLGIQPVVHFVTCLPVMAYIICLGKGKTFWEQVRECCWSAFVNVMFIQVRYSKPSSKLKSTIETNNYFFFFLLSVDSLLSGSCLPSGNCKS
jgi:hypothetical protein